jgi:uncharacterized protein (TIGR03067 family)
MKSISHLVGLVATIVLIGSERTGAAEESQALKKLQGKWVAVSAEMDGRPLEPAELKNISLTIHGNQLKRKPSALLIVSDPNDPNEEPTEIDTSAEEYKFRLDPARNPQHLDLEIGWSGIQTARWKLGKPIYSKSIYSVDNDKLRICWGNDVRPKAFKTNPGDGLVLLEYKRVGAAEED